MSIPIEDVFFKSVAPDGEPIIVRMSLPQIDARDAVARFPHQYATTVDGHADKPLPVAVDEAAGSIGPGGGNPALLGGVGVKEVIRPGRPAKHPKGSVAA